MSLDELESRTLIRRLNVTQSSTITFNIMVVLILLHFEVFLFLNLYYCFVFHLSHFPRWQSTSLEVQASSTWTNSSFFTHPYPSFPCSSPSLHLSHLSILVLFSPPPHHFYVFLVLTSLLFFLLLPAELSCIPSIHILPCKKPSKMFSFPKHSNMHVPPIELKLCTFLLLPF